MDEETANEIIMAARAHWFGDEAPAEGAEHDAAAEEGLAEDEAIEDEEAGHD